jgi:hypothetical protein
MRTQRSHGAGAAVRDAQTTLVLSIYGSTMLKVQAFEQTLATLMLALQVKAEAPRTYPTPRHFHRHVRRLLKKYIHAYQHATASELRQKLPEGFDPALVEEIEEATEYRDLLAHRFLIARLAPGGQGGEGIFKRGTITQLVRLGEGFDALIAKLLAAQTAATDSLPKADNAPAWLRDFFGSMARPIMFGERFEPPGDAPS